MPSSLHLARTLLRLTTLGYLLGGGLAAALAVWALARLLPADLPGVALGAWDIAVLSMWGAAAGSGHWWGAERTLWRVVRQHGADAAEQLRPLGTLANGLRWPAGALVRGLLGWPVFAALMLLVGPALQWATERIATSPGLSSELSGVLSATAGTLLAVALGRVEGRAAVRRLRRALG
ncbi:MAG: hypothetical protein MUD17_02460 [Gemmatimonadaceae bacterium]|nr:hypothetical protein [Gemmatimonadaceae bacterium]